MTESTSFVIEVSDLFVDYGTFRAVDRVSFTVSRGQTLALVGESGSGKSTIAMAIMRLLGAGAHASGQIVLHGEGQPLDLIKQTEEQMRSIRGAAVAMVFQEPMTSLNPVMTVGAQIAEAVRLHQPVSRGEAVRIALDSLRRARLTDPEKKMEQYPHQLSGGMRQRVMIAMALACRPALLIADEPTTALDVTVQAEMLRLIHDLQDETGMGVLYITHDLGVVAQIADDVVVMRNGKIVEAQPVIDIFDKPEEAYTRRLLDSVPVLGSASTYDRPVKFQFSDASSEEKLATLDLPISQRGKVLEVRSLSKTFVVEKTPYLGRPTHVLQAVRDVSFDLHCGETLAVVGESGSGKSTMARAVMQLLAPDTGSVRLQGSEIVGLSRSNLRDHRARMQMVFQDPYASLNPKMTVAQIIAEPLIIQGRAGRADQDRVSRGLLERVGLPADFAKRLPQQLSGGQRQRVSIARALATEPSVIVLDEAVSSLDVTVQAQIVNLLIDLQREKGLSYLFISHDMGIVERISHRVAVMHMGSIVELGGKREVLQSPAHPYTKRLLSAVLRPDPSQRLARTPSQPLLTRSAVRPIAERAQSVRYAHVGSDHLIIADDITTAAVG